MVMGFDCITKCASPTILLLLLVCLWIYNIFSDRFQSFVNGYIQQLIVTLVFLWGGEPKSFYSAILPSAPINNLLLSGRRTLKHEQIHTIPRYSFLEGQEQTSSSLVLISVSVTPLVLHHVFWFSTAYIFWPISWKKGIMEIFWRIVEGTSECKPINPWIVELSSFALTPYLFGFQLGGVPLFVSAPWDNVTG